MSKSPKYNKNYTDQLAQLAHHCFAVSSSHGCHLLEQKGPGGGKAIYKQQSIYLVIYEIQIVK